MEIIKEDCQSMEKTDKMKQEKERVKSNIPDGALPKINSSQQVISQQTIVNYNETNARCENNL
jgi:hypothetical protein